MPGVDYTPVSGTLTFGLGVTVENFTVPIIDDLSLQIDKTVNLVLASPTGGATLGVPSSAILTIEPALPPVPPPPPTCRNGSAAHHQSPAHCHGHRRHFQRAAQPDDGRQSAQLQLQRDDRRPQSRVRNPRQPAHPDHQRRFTTRLIWP